MTQGELQGTALRPAGAVGGERPARQPAAVYSAETAAGPDHLGRGAQAAFLAEVVAHRAVETPLCLGIFGPAGSGKSTFLAAMLANVEAIGHAATEAGLATPFHGDLVVARVTAQPGMPTPRALMQAVASALAGAHPRLLDEAAHAGLDARAVAREAADELAAAREKLDAERQALDGLAGRQARIAETILFENEGSGIDTYVRGNRGRIERRMRAFGVANDPIVAFKTQVREAHEATTPVARGLGWLRAFTAYRGQGRLLVLCVALLLASWGLHALSDNQAKVTGAVQAGGDKMTGLTDWLAAQWHWLIPVRRLFELGALVALAVNLVRGLGLLLPLHRGVGLLRQDLDSRRRELDGRLAQQTRRVDTLARDIDRLSRRASDAQDRLPAGDAATLPPSFAAGIESHDGLAAAQAFFATVGTATTGGEGRSRTSAPARVVVGLDGLESLTSNEAAAAFETVAGLLARPGMVLVMAADRTHLATGFSETDPALASEKLRRLVQVPFDLGAGEAWSGAAAYARALLDGDGREGALPQPTDVALSVLDRPWTAAEGAVLEAVVPLAGTTPRSVKQVVNLYRIARAEPLMRDAPATDLAGLALGLALQARGLPLDRAGGATEGGDINDIAEARRAIGTALGSSFGVSDGRLGTDVARDYSTGR